MEILRVITIGFNFFILIYALCSALMELTQTIVALVEAYRESRIVRVLASQSQINMPELTPFSIIVPAHNESVVVLESLRSFLGINYPAFEVVLVNDGSTDDTLEKVIKEYGLTKSPYPVQIQVPCATIRGSYSSPEFPNLIVVDKESAGNKGDASNAGINASRYPYFVGVDADSLLDKDSLFWISRQFMEDRNVKAVGGAIRLSNGKTIKGGRVPKWQLPKSKLARFQIIEYYRSFLVGRIFWSKINALMIISGACGAFEKKTVINVGGYTQKTAGEDMDLVVKIHRYMKKTKQKYKIVFSPHAICWTQVPENMRDFNRQRRRWGVGNMQVIHRYFGMMLNPKYGTVGLIALPYYLLYEYLSVAIVLLGVLFIPLNIYFGLVILPQIFLLLIFAMILGIITSVGSLIVNTIVTVNDFSKKDFLKLVAYCILENFTFRPYVFLLRLQALFGYTKYLHVWDSITRKAFDKVSDNEDVEEKR